MIWKQQPIQDYEHCFCYLSFPCAKCPYPLWEWHVYKTGTWGANGAFPPQFCRGGRRRKKRVQFTSNCLEMSPQLINTNLYCCKKGSKKEIREMALCVMRPMHTNVRPFCSISPQQVVVQVGENSFTSSQLLRLLVRGISDWRIFGLFPPVWRKYL